MHRHLHRAAAPLRLVKLCDCIGDRTPDIVGEVQVEIVDLDVDGRLLVRLDALCEIGRDRDDRHHLDLVIELAGLLRRGIADTEHAGIVKNVLHLDALRPVIERHQCHGAATDRRRAQRTYQQEAESWNEYYR